MEYLTAHPGAVVAAVLAVVSVLWLGHILMPRRTNHITTVGPSEPNGDGRRFSGLMTGLFLGIAMFLILLLVLWLANGMPDTFLNSSVV